MMETPPIGVVTRMVEMPEPAIPRRKYGLAFWKSASLVGAFLSPVFGVFGPLRAIVALWAPDAAPVLDGLPTAADTTTAIAGVAAALDGLASVAAALWAMWGRYNGGVAPSPIVLSEGPKPTAAPYPTGAGL